MTIRFKTSEDPKWFTIYLFCLVACKKPSPWLALPYFFPPNPPKVGIQIKASISVTRELIVSTCIPCLFHISSLVLSLLQTFFPVLSLTVRSFVVFIPGALLSSLYCCTLPSHFLFRGQVNFLPTNILHCTLGRWAEFRGRKDYAAYVNWLVVYSCLEVLLNFILQEMSVFKMLSSF